MLAFVFSSCSTFRPVRDPWSEKYIHHSGKYELGFRRLYGDSMIVEAFEVPYSSHDRPRMNFVAQITKDKLVHQALREPDCRIELRLIEGGVMWDDFCHGSGEDDGFYRLLIKN